MAETLRDQAGRRSAGEWWDIYIELVESQFKAGCVNPEVWRGVRDRLRSLKADFEAAGLSMSDDIDLFGPDPSRCSHVNRTGNPLGLWPKGVEPWIRIEWPDGQHLHYRGEKALSATAFMMWYVNMATMVSPPDATPTIIQPGDARWSEYWAAKARDQKSGAEPR